MTYFNDSNNFFSKGETGSMTGIFKLYPHIKVLKKIVYHLFQFVSSKKMSVTNKTHSLPLGTYAKTAHLNAQLKRFTCNGS